MEAVLCMLVIGLYIGVPKCQHCVMEVVLRVPTQCRHREAVFEHVTFVQV